MKKSLFSQPELLEGQKPLSIQIPKEHIEQWIVQSIGAKPVGAGNYPIDVIIQDVIGADVKMISCKVDQSGKLRNAISNESSLLQNFSGTGSDLDTLFQKKDYKSICDGWKDMLHQKLSKAKNDHDLSKFMYIFILRGFDVFYLCAFEVRMEQLADVTHGKGNDTNLHLNGFIDERMGQVQIYKSKKRLELRLQPHFLVENGYCLSLDMPYRPQYQNMREMIHDDSLKEFQLKLFEGIFQ